MERKIDAERVLTTLVHIWADQHSQKITDITISRRGTNEEKITNDINLASGF